jgi:hypothetical protein
MEILQSGFGLEGAAHEQGDADGDGLVDGNDFVLWQQQLNAPQPLPESFAAPEPAACALTFGGLGPLAIWRRRIETGLRRI